MTSKNQISPTIVTTVESDPNKKHSFFISIRFLLSIVLFFGFTINYMQRTNISIAIVCMVNSTAVAELEGGGSDFLNLTSTGTDSECVDQLSSSALDGKFVWKKADQGLILAAYFYGYMISQIPGGWLAMRFGARLIILVATVIPSVLTIVTPLVANLDSPLLLIVLRFIIGLIHGVIFSAIAYLFSHWTPVKEKSALIGFAQAGISFGNVVSWISGGVLCENGFYEGWGSIFVLFGSFGLVWSILFFFLVADSPLDHKFITKRELEYIMANIPHSVPSKKTPWKEIFKSKACWAIFITNFTFNWGGYLFLTQTPTYLKDVLKFNIRANGFFSSLPFMACFLVTLIAAFIADKLVSRNVMSLKNCRKLFNSLGNVIPMVICVILGFINCSQATIAVVLLTIAVGANGFVIGAGFFVNINDIGGKNYSGVVYGISNTFGSLSGIIAPYFVGLMTPTGSVEEWRVVFLVTACFYLIGTIPFILFAQTSVQEWAMPIKQMKIEQDRLESANTDKPLELTQS